MANYSYFDVYRRVRVSNLVGSLVVVPPIFLVFAWPYLFHIKRLNNFSNVYSLSIHFQLEMSRCLL